MTTQVATANHESDAPPYAGACRRATGARWVTLILAWSLLNIVISLRFPAGEDRLWYLLPSQDVTVVLLVFAAIGRFGGRVARWVLGTLTVGCLVVRCLKIADGLEIRYYSRNFNSYMDLPLTPELLRLAHTTLSHPKFVLLCLAVPFGAGGLSYLTYHCWRYWAQAVREPRVNSTFLWLLLLLVVASPFGKSAYPYRGLFAASVIPRLYAEIRFAVNAKRYLAEVTATVARVDAELQRYPSDFAQLNRGDVYLLIVESYGETVLDGATVNEPIRDAWRRFRIAVANRDFAMASGILDSPTYGAGSWLAHSTLDTGIWVNDQFHHRAVCNGKPLTLSGLFTPAGYHTVLAEPATTRPWREGDCDAFDEVLRQKDFAYRGPGFSWAPMPDQYVLQFVGRRLIARKTMPVFAQIVLVSSHAPWNIQPPWIQDAASIGDGSVYFRLPPVRFPTGWSDMSRARGAYVRSIVYDLDAIADFIRRYATDSSLTVIVGDHQPNGEVTGNSKSFGVPIHVVSRNRTLVQRFVARGLTPNATLSDKDTHIRMDRFLPIFLDACSSDHKLAQAQTP